MINIALCFDLNYKEMALAVVRSVLSHSDKNNCAFYLVVDMDECEIQKTSEQLTAIGAAFYIKTVDQTLFEGLTTKGHITRAAFMRLELARIFPELTKVLYLDSDLVVTGDVQTLWHIDMDNKPLAAVKNAGKDGTARLGLSRSHVYFNSGVMLMDLTFYRAQNVRERAYQWLQENNASRAFHDQDALNVIYEDKVHELPIRFNMQAFLYRFYLSYSKQQQQEIKDENAKKLIVHFSSGRKPWQKGDLHPYGKLFLEHYVAPKTATNTAFSETLKRVYLWLYYRVVMFKLRG